MLPNWKERLSSLVSEAVLQSFEIEDFKKNNILPKEKIIASISRPRNSGNGDASSNIAFLLSKIFNSNPMEISSKILQFIEDSKVVTEKNLCKKIEIARPGFINFWFSDRTKFDVIREIFTNKEFGYNKKKCSGQKIIIEYVSANPTGPLHVGHARQAVLGDSIANILIAHGAEVFREFYYNDAGNQIDNLTNSVKARMNGITPSDPLFPVDGYQGDYIKEIAK